MTPERLTHVCGLCSKHDNSTNELAMGTDNPRELQAQQNACTRSSALSRAALPTCSCQIAGILQIEVKEDPCMHYASYMV